MVEHTVHGFSLSGPRGGLPLPTCETAEERTGENGDGADASPNQNDGHGETERRNRLHQNEKQKEQRKKKGRRTKAHIKVASLNVNGRGNLTGRNNNKWNTINQVMKEQRIGILCVQETHLTNEHIDTIHTLYGWRMHLLNSAGDRATAAHGVAFVLNRELVDTAQVHIKEILPGRAAYITMHWHQEKTLTILNIYAPNSTGENQTFWNHLLNAYATGAHKKPDVILGDFNLVEEAVDRLPTKN